MLYRLLTVVFLLVVAAGCKEKQFKKDKAPNVDVVHALNEGHPEEVIAKFSDRADLRPRDRYYLASALAQKGKVDVFSLYPILEIQLFHKSSLEWSDLSKDKNPYLKFLKVQDNVDKDKRRAKREKRWERYEPALRSRYTDGLIRKPDIASIEQKASEQEKEHGFTYSPEHNVTAEKFSILDVKLNEAVEKILKERHQRDGDLSRAYNREVNKLLTPGLMDADYKGNYFHGCGDLVTYHWGELVVKNKKELYLDPEKFFDGTFGAVRWELIYMNLLWNTYEAIPLIKKLPVLSDADQDEITKALDEFYLLKDEPEFKTVAMKNMLIIAGISLLSDYKGSFDLEEVSDMQDFFCSFEPTHLIENHPRIRQRFLFIRKLLESQSGKDADTIRQNMDKLESAFPEHLSEREQAEYIAKVDEFKINYCFTR